MRLFIILACLQLPTRHWQPTLQAGSLSTAIKTACSIPPSRGLKEYA